MDEGWPLGSGASTWASRVAGSCSWWLHMTAKCEVCGEIEAGGMFLTWERGLGSGAHRCRWVPEGLMVAQAQQWAPSPGDVGAR